MEKWITKIRSLTHTIHSILFPKHCVGCQTKETYLCSECENKIIRQGNFGDKMIFSLVSYREPLVRKLIWLLKYRGVKEIAEIFGNWLYEALIEDLAKINLYHEKQGRILVVPIPLSAKRLRQRGFNQAEEIANQLQKIDPKLFQIESQILIKQKETRTQVSVKNRRDRLKNLKGAFTLKTSAKIRGRIVVLLDDVCTTGATMNEAARVIGRGKPRRVIRVTVAGE